MTTPDPPALAPRLAVRCDGGASIGAGHVARCIPLAVAFADRGWQPSFVGRYEGLAAWLLDRAGQTVAAPTTGPCGLAAEEWDAAVVDLYGVAEDEMCELAARVPVATLGEASRCPDAGMLIDYRLDAEACTDGRVLAGPSFAPLDPAFAGAGRANDAVRAVLITVGGSEPALIHVPYLRELVARHFPEAELIIPRGGGPDRERPTHLLELVGRVDLAVSAAGLTSYELACAGIPQAVVAIVENQSPIVQGLRRLGLAPGVDLPGGETLDALDDALAQLREPGPRRSLSRRGRATFDGRGAGRAADGLLAGWSLRSTLPRGGSSAARPTSK